MPSFRPRPPTRDTVLLSGWLFADLLLGLAVIFMAANTVGVKPQVIPTPTPISKPSLTPTITPRPAPPPLPRLELRANRITLTIDTAGLLNKSSTAINNLKSQIHAQRFLQHRRAGLVIAYGSAPDTGQIQRAQNVANHVMATLQALGKEGFVFAQASYYDPLYTLNTSDQDTIIIDIYLFA